MARIRGQAFLATGQAEICAVVSQHLETARVCAAELDCSLYGDDIGCLAEGRPDAVLIETPHKAQDEIAVWALEEDLDLLIGGSLACSLASGIQIAEMAAQRGRIVEAGYQCRYDLAWEEIRRLIHSGVLGAPIMAVSMALWSPDPERWYYDQAASGGMPVTHMSYCYLNAIRWIMGVPETVTAMANRKVETGPGRVLEETCAACIGFENGAFASATASYARPEGMDDAETRFVCSEGGIQVHTDSITVFQHGTAKIRSFKSTCSPFIRQAQAFLQALEKREPANNPPEDALLDLRIGAAISLSAREKRTIFLRDGHRYDR